MVLMGVLAPHPPLLIPKIGGGHRRQVEATDRAMREMAERVTGQEPETIVVISPHSPLLADAVAVNLTPVLSGGFAAFGSSERLDFDNDLPLAEALVAEIEAGGTDAVRLTPEAMRGGRRLELDHGVLVPMYYLHEAGFHGKLVVMSMALLPPKTLHRVGAAIPSAAARVRRRVVVMASGDLSHRLTHDAPAGYDPRGGDFDRQIVELLRKGDAARIMEMDEGFCESAGECGYRSIVMMLGALDGAQARPEVLSYEGPFGVGYAVATFTPVPDVTGGKAPAMVRSE